MVQTKYLIIGGSAAGISAGNTLLRLEPGAKVLCVMGQSAQPYNKCFLVDWLAGSKTRTQLDLIVSSQIQFLNNRVVSLDIQAGIASLDNGKQVKYEKALLAIGVQPFVPEIVGLKQASHVFTFHDLQDTQKMQNFIQVHKSQNVVIIGAGLTGVECADALWRLGLQVTLLERSSQILGKLADEAGAQALEAWILEQNVQIYKNVTVTSINSNAVTLDSGQVIPSDLVVIAAGVRPNKIELVGGELNYLGSYVQVDQYLQTNLPNVWAAGDMVVLPDLLTGQLVPSCSWPDAMLQGNLAANNMVGNVKPFPGLLTIASSHFFGKDFISLGKLNGDWHDLNATQDSYQKKFFNNQNKLQGALLIGDITPYPIIKRTILTQ